MAPQYFSRQFRKQTGQTFYHSLIAVRLRHAKQDMLESDTPLLRLALSNGFANLESFTGIFRRTPEKHHRSGVKKNAKQMICGRFRRFRNL